VPPPVEIPVVITPQPSVLQAPANTPANTSQTQLTISTKALDGGIELSVESSPLSPKLIETLIPDAQSPTSNQGKNSRMSLISPIDMGLSSNENPLLEYAMFHFRNDEMPKTIVGTIRGTIRKFNKDLHKDNSPAMEANRIKTRLTHGRNMIQRSFNSLAYEDEKIFLDIYLLILKYMGDAPEKESNPLELARYIICRSMECSIAVKTEVFLSLIRQITGNPSDKSEEKGWWLLEMITSYIAPQHLFYSPTFLEWINYRRNYDKEHTKQLDNIEINVKTITKHGVREIQPTLEEVTFMQVFM
jgi:hypothetical protein